MKQFKKIISWWFTALFLVSFMAGNAFATPIKPIRAYVESAAPVNIGEKTFIPVQIDWLNFKLKSAKISFKLDTRLPLQEGVSADSVKIEETIVDVSKLTSFPYTVYVPVTVTGEGRFDFEGALHIEALDGKMIFDKEYFDYPLDGPGIFAFENRVFFGGSSGSAMEAAAAENLKKTNSEYNKLLNKKENTGKGILKQTFSKEEEDILKRLYKEGTESFFRKYDSKHPNKPSPTSRLFRELNKPQKDDTVALEVNWAVDNTYTSFLPLHGAQITVYANENNNSITQISKGVLNNGKYSFISPRDNLSFTAKVTAKYGNDFEVKNATGSVIEIGFKDATSFNIRTVVDNINPLIDINSTEANAWSVFQAFTEIQRLARNELGFTKQSGYSVYVGSGGSYYDKKDIYLLLRDSFDWDVIAHEFGHAIAHETSSTISYGGSHDGSNQYDYSGNGGTYLHKENSLKLAFNEGYGTWIGVALLKNSAYKGKVANIGDDIYHDTDDAYIAHNLEGNALSYYGEDTEYAIANLLWDTIDSVIDSNIRAVCKTECKDSLSISLLNVFNGALKGNNIASISDFYKYFYTSYVSKDPSSVFNAAGSVNADQVTKTHQLGALFAEFGIAPAINEGDNNEKAFYGIYKPNFTPPTLVWKHLQTGNSALYLDKFEILFFNKDKTGLLYKVVIPNILTPNTNKEYRYTMNEEEVNALRTALKITYALGINVMIKGTASGSKAGGAVQTGPYYSNLASFAIDDNKFYVIAVDSSGSNTWTDPSNLRIGAAHKMLKSMADINKNLLENANNTDARSILTAAIDFDSSTRILAPFTEPEELYNRKVFNAIDSSGGTHIAGAIIRSVDLIVEQGSSIVDLFYNRNNLYVLTDMEDNWLSVVAAIVHAGANGVIVNIGHLSPIAVSSKISQNIQNNVYEINGDPINQVQPSGNILMKARTPFDDVIEAILKTGGSYVVIQDAASQEAWVDLMTYLSGKDPENLEEIPLPFNIQYYGLARDGKSTPTFLITPKSSGMVTISVDTKGSFVPNIKYDDKGEQEDLGLNDYRIKFMAAAGKTYRITIGDSLEDSGLYSIVANIETIKASLLKSSLITTGADIDENGNVFVWGFRGSGQQGNGKLSVSSHAPAS
ncbi:MAG: hypothetical protein LBS26_04930, partial [Campylobacteraceae bacterium]|nr:hypothetical protein [Campylobacteraceae bacterium]